MDTRKIADDLEAEYLAVANGVKTPAKIALEPMVRAVEALRSIAVPASAAAALEKPAASPWIAVGEQWPKAEWDKYYHDDFSEPVAVMIDYNGNVRRSESTWRYSFAHGGWVGADLREGYKPSDYEEFGRVTHWAPLPESLAAPASSKENGHV